MPTADKSLTFLFTDIEGSARLWSEYRQAMATALAWHDQGLRRCIEDEGGTVVKRTGDGVHAAFVDPVAALRASVRIQQLMQAEPADGGLALQVRCGLHAGYDEAREGDYFGPEVNRAARIMSVAHGGQILVSDALAGHLGPGLADGWRLQDLGRVRLRGFDGTDRLWQVVVPGLREAFPPLRELAEVPHNLPAPATRFFGRADELRQLDALLPTERLVLLHGLGGMGKTRLAIEAARRAVPRFEDGVFLVELSQVSDPTLVPLAVASVLGVKEEAGQPLAACIARLLASRHLLLVLDNCEQVVEACARLVDGWLAQAPRLHVLATSREHLRLTAERVLELGGFDLPPEPGVRRAVPGDESPVTAAAGSAPGDAGDVSTPGGDAAALFIDRVQAVQPGFQPDPAGLQRVHEICRRLDGIPLALELAAAATRRMPLARLAERLENRFSVLVHGQRVATDRQKTLRGLIDWSHELLSPPQRRVFARLSVFAGGWTPEAAEAVCADEELPTDAVLEPVGELVEKSLVQFDLSRGRYRMLDTVRQYAQERLEADPPAREAAQGQHLAYFLDLAEQAHPHIGGPQQKVWLETLDLERDNLLSAHVACGDATQRAEAGVRLSWALKPYWLNRGLLGLGLRVASEALDRSGLQDLPAVRCGALADVGQLCFFVGQYQKARSYLSDCVALSRDLGLSQAEILALQPLGMACLHFDAVDEAQAHLMRALALAKAADHERFQAYIESALGQLMRVRHRYDEALDFTRTARSRAARQDDQDLQCITVLNEAMILLSLKGHDTRAARTLLSQALEVCVQGQSRALIQSAAEVASAIACDESRWADAAEFWSWAEAMARSSGLQRDPADERFLRAYVARLEGALGPQVLHRVVANVELQPDDAVVSRLQNWLGAPAADVMEASRNGYRIMPVGSTQDGLPPDGTTQMS